MAGKRFSQRHYDALTVAAMVPAMARADGWQSLDACETEQPLMVERYLRLAEAGLRAVRRVERMTDPAKMH